MSVCYAHIAIDDFGAGPQGAKEALVMAVEHLGGVRVLSMELREAEQMRMDGAAPASPAAPPVRSKGKDGQARDGAASRPKRSAPNRAIGCFNCAHYRKTPGWDGAGQAFYGWCALSDPRVYKLFDLCRGWVDKAQ